MKTSPLLLALAIPAFVFACSSGDNVKSKERCERAVAKIMVDWNSAWTNRPKSESRDSTHDRLFDSFNEATNESAVRRCMKVGLSDSEAACIADAPAGFIAAARCLGGPKWEQFR